MIWIVYSVLLNYITIIRTKKSLKYHLDQSLYKYVVYKEITHSFTPSVKKLN